ncbi:type ISP restriction/modification enzyme [Sphingomonas sp. SUN039]|uniref:type ISP restriction/modification enzyme n=1 Tax=Sphingomonas sp. SUN039 TaxID=2937787 RepID=UPI002164B290|nr:type ISP restriction/modification enzyme [Sphingomonas sp. SUN039]UVO55294.1 N-6 DNA methylase [Sphingomonas sp. SUN039]
MQVEAYLESVRKTYASGSATEHSYRPALQALFAAIDPALSVINEPKKSEAGMPDFLFDRGGVPVGWAEAKDIDKDVIRLKGYSVEQRKRYERAYPNLIYTNGVDFEFIREGVQVHFVSIADFMGQLGGLQPKPDCFDELARQLKLFAEAKPISIRSAKKLAEMMAAKAAIIKDEVGIALKDDPEFRSGLGGQFKSFKANLLPALEPDEFADIYAETITYGMFAARFHDDSLDTFSRAEALEKLPASNPFLKGLFEYIAGPSLPNRLKYIVDDLVQVMRASDPHSLFEGYGKFTARNDPFVHFYEDFLAAYNPKKRKSRGVWYTPEPVVDFIVRAVDDVLKTEFGLVDGLADTSKVTVDWDTGTNDPKTGKAVTTKREVHKVQILDPATGTGTFLAKAVQLISDRVKARAPGKWSGYVEADLLPRLHGFELLMASYAMCHMKLDMQLTQSGYKPSASPPRLSVWLTNALEPAEREVRDLFFQPLAEEARGASAVKRQTPIMCVMGNPPYSISSSNQGAWITGLIGPYKQLSERNLQPINDDYVKFLRMAEYLVSKNGQGVVAMITNHGYLTNPTFREMRRHLLQTFVGIRVLDLHGNANKEERSPDGGPDQNVFDIRQGVCVLVGWVRTSSDRKPASVRHADLWGSRSSKNAALHALNVADPHLTEITPSAPYFLLSNLDGASLETYNSGFKLTDLFVEKNTGVKTHRDQFVIDLDAPTLKQRISAFFDKKLTDSEVATTYDISSSPSWNMTNARSGRFDDRLVQPIQYRPFDYQSIYYDTSLIDRHRLETVRHVLGGRNISLLCPRMTADDFSAFVSVDMISNKTGNRYDQSYFLPLYLIPDEASAQADAFAPKNRTLNLDPKLYAAICAAAGIDPAEQAGPDDDFRAASGDARPSEVRVFDYIYGVLHAPDYRRAYAEFLKIDFPRIPYPPSAHVFAHISEKGEALRRLHLMEAAAIDDTPYPYVGDGDDVVAAGYPKFEDGKVWINKDQHFDAVPPVSWAFPIGGYTPAQKWLKDRRGRTLSWDDIGHYQRIVKILIETDRIMKEIVLPLDEGEAA